MGRPQAPAIGNQGVSQSFLTLGREVDAVSGTDQRTGFVHQHPAWLHVTALTCGSVRRIGVVVGVLELERDATPHDANGVDGVDHHLNVGLQEVAYSIDNHLFPPSYYQTGRRTTGEWYAAA